jgi:hypothetical protein
MEKYLITASMKEKKETGEIEVGTIAQQFSKYY